MIRFLVITYALLCLVSFTLTKRLNRGVDNPTLNFLLSPVFNAVVCLLILGAGFLFRSYSSRIIYLLVWNAIMIGNVYSIHKLKNMDF